MASANSAGPPNAWQGRPSRPFEVQTSMLISLPRDEGGFGIDITNNVRIPLSEAARSLYDKTCCYADILIQSSTDSMGVILNAKAAPPTTAKPRVSDAERTTAPHKHGLRRHQITFGQIKDKKSFDHIAELIHKRPGFPTPQRLNRSALPKMPCGKSYLSIGLSCSLPGRPASS